jgi:hypothetical protein
MRRAALVLAATAAMACGPGDLKELPLATSQVNRNGILRTVGTSERQAYVLHRSPVAGASTAADVSRWDGMALSFIDLPDEAQTTTIALLEADHVVTGGTRVYEIRGTTATEITDQLMGSVRYLVAGRGDGTVYALGSDVLFRRRAGATAWESMTAPPGGTIELVVAAPDRLVVVGNGDRTQADTIYHFNGTSWDISVPPTRGRQLSAASADDVWALPLLERGATPLYVLAYDGRTWTQVPINVTAQMRGNDPGALTVQGVVALGGGRAGAVVLRKYAPALMPPRWEILWITGGRAGLGTQSVVRVYCQTAGCPEGGDFTGAPERASDGTLFVGPYYGAVPGG